MYQIDNTDTVSPHWHIEPGQRPFIPHLSDAEAEPHMVKDSTKGSATRDTI